jgi:SAM-dependent methyltransferase
MSTAILGFDQSKASAHEIWRENAGKWPFIGPPWRPSPGDVAIYRRFARPRLPGRTLLLGSTPELRDLLAEYAGAMPKPLIVDMSLPMLQSTSALACRAQPAHEEWLVADWCEADLPEHAFDVVLADMVWWTVSVPTQAALRRRIDRLLAPGGIFVSRFRCREPARAGDDPRAITAGFLARLGTGVEDEQRLRDAWLSHLYDITADVAGRRMNRKRARALIEAMRDDARDPGQRAFFETSLSRLIGADWTAQTREEILGPLLESFVLLDEACADDYEASAYPIIALASKARVSPAA